MRVRVILSIVLQVGLFVPIFVGASERLSADSEVAMPIPHGSVELVAEDRWLSPRYGTNLGLHFSLDNGWHIYWINPGDSAEPHPEWAAFV